MDSAKPKEVSFEVVVKSESEGQSVFGDDVYIVLPVQSGASLEKAQGWGAFSGTSAASPMVAGVCALLKETAPQLTPAEVKNILKHTARDITTGVNAHGRPAGPGPDGATGFGLVDAERAIEALV